MKERIVEYFKTNKWWILVFLIMVIADSLLTLFIVANKYGVEANPFVGDKVFDWSFHFWRIDAVLLMIPLISMLKWSFARNYLLQGVTVAYGYTVLNALCILLFDVDISIYQFIPQWLYFPGVLFQFSMGMIVLWIYRRIRGRRIPAVS